MTDNLDDLRDRYSTMSDEDLIQIVTVNASEYREDALRLAKEELSSRGNTDLSQHNNETSSVADKQKSKSPLVRISARIFLYPTWLIIWIIISGIFYSMARQNIGSFIYYLLHDVLNFSNIKTIAVAQGAFITASMVFLIFVLVKGFLFVHRITK